jgi:hypothetical protein
MWPNIPVSCEARSQQRQTLNSYVSCEARSQQRQTVNFYVSRKARKKSRQALNFYVSCEARSQQRQSVNRGLYRKRKKVCSSLLSFPTKPGVPRSSTCQPTMRPSSVHSPDFTVDLHSSDFTHLSTRQFPTSLF